MSKKLKIGVVFGGRSGEHEVSLVSAGSIIKALDKKKYQIIPIGITKAGEWVSGKSDLLELFKKEKIKKGSRLPPEILTKVDVIFPVLHGTYGEDGTIQGLFEMLNVSYIGAGVLGSAIGMDKVVQKQLCEQAKLPIVRYVSFSKEEWEGRHTNILRHIKKALKYPCFVKPANLGSSVGISKAHNKKELITGIKLAVKYDKKILVEQAVKNTREIECSVLGNEKPIASLPGEVVASGEFYDYNAKYVDGRSKTIVPAELSKNFTRKIQELACRVFEITNCAGMARVDFLLDGKSQKIYLNEINTIPGFTSISMYPKLWQASGISYKNLLDKLIRFAISRAEKKNKLKLFYKPDKKWYL